MSKLGITLNVPNNFMLAFEPEGEGVFKFRDLTITVNESIIVVAHPEKTFEVAKGFTTVGIFDDKFMVGNGREWTGSFYFMETAYPESETVIFKEPADLELNAQLYYCDYYNSLHALDNKAVSMVQDWRAVATKFDAIPLSLPQEFASDFCLAVFSEELEDGIAYEQGDLKLEVSGASATCTFGTTILPLELSGLSTLLIIDRFEGSLMFSDGFKSTSTNTDFSLFNDQVDVSVQEGAVIAIANKSICRGVRPKVERPSFLNEATNIDTNEGTVQVGEHVRLVIGVSADKYVSLTDSVKIASGQLSVGGIQKIVPTDQLSTLILERDDLGYNVWLNSTFVGFVETEEVEEIKGEVFSLAIDSNANEARYRFYETAELSEILLSSPRVGGVGVESLVHLPTGQYFEAIVDRETPGGPYVAALSFITTPRSINLSNVLAKSFATDTYTRNEGLEPVLPTGLNVHVEKTLVKHSHPSWVAEVGDWVVLTNRDLTNGLYLNSEGVQAWNEKRGEFRLYDARAGWWGHSDSSPSPVFGLMTRLGNSGLCGGSYRVGVPACPIAVPNPNSSHFDKSHLTQVFFKLI